MLCFLFCQLTLIFVSVFFFSSFVICFLSVRSWYVRSVFCFVFCWFFLLFLLLLFLMFFFLFLMFFCFFFVLFADAGAGGGSVLPLRGLPRQRYPGDMVCSSSPRSVSEDIGHELTLLAIRIYPRDVVCSSFPRSISSRASAMKPTFLF